MALDLSQIPPEALPYLDSLKKLSKRELAEMARQQAELERKLAIAGPQNRDQLHSWIKHNLGYDIPRKSVCHGHTSPFDFLADLYFGPTTSAVAMANRGGSKTFMVAMLHYLNSRFKPGIESCTVGAIEMQARRAYAHLQKLVDKVGQDEVAATTMIDTRWRNGSRVEVLPGTISAVNGPHPCVVHVDEVELMDPEVYQESRNMSQSQVVYGRQYPAQDIITSTRKRGHGPMQNIIDSIHVAEADGREPPYKLYTWCVFEVAQNVPNCRVANPGCANPCPCNEVPGGRFADGRPRTLEDVCQGRFSKSDGFVPLSDIINTFTKASPEIWEAQQECSRPSSEGLIFPGFDKHRYGVIDWTPDPGLGPIFMSVDFGGTAPHAVNWYQVLRYEVDAQTPHGTKRLKEGAIVCFDEIYKAEIGNNQLAAMIVQREALWRKKVRGWKVMQRYGDIAAKAARLDFAQHDPPLRLVHYITREIEEHIKVGNEYISKDRFYVDLGRCPMFIEEIEAWHRDRNTEKPVDMNDHVMSNFRYFVAHINRAEAHGKKGRGPRAVQRKSLSSGPSARSSGVVDPWRSSLGGTASSLGGP